MGLPALKKRLERWHERPSEAGALNVCVYVCFFVLVSVENLKGLGTTVKMKRINANVLGGKMVLKKSWFNLWDQGFQESKVGQ